MPVGGISIRALRIDSESCVTGRGMTKVLPSKFLIVDNAKIPYIVIKIHIFSRACGAIVLLPPAGLQRAYLSLFSQLWRSLDALG